MLTLISAVRERPVSQPQHTGRPTFQNHNASRHATIRFPHTTMDRKPYAPSQSHPATHFEPQQDTVPPYMTASHPTTLQLKRDFPANP